MTSFYYTRIKDEIKHRITIEKEVWDNLELKKGDLVKVTIEKVEK